MEFRLHCASYVLSENHELRSWASVLGRGWERVPAVEAEFILRRALAAGSGVRERLIRFWLRQESRPDRGLWRDEDIVEQLRRRLAGGPAARLRLSRRWELPEIKEPPLLLQDAVRTAMDAAEAAPRAFVEVEVVDGEGQPVSGVRLELLFADGSVRTSGSNSSGRVYVDGIPQGAVHIRVLDRDGRTWQPAEGAASTQVDQRSKRAHVVGRGESLAPLAARSGFAAWDDVWEADDNRALREERGNPSRLQAGDELVIPALPVHEIVRPTDRTHRIVLPKARTRTAHVLEAEELHFHHDSAVFLGERGDLTAGDAARGTSGIDVLATALRHAEAHPERKLLIVGHTDASGEASYNQALSEKRANSVLHLLRGEGDAWAQLAHSQSAIEDYQQILGWLSLVFGWPCAPLSVDGEPSDDNARIVRAFQASYNKDFDGSLAEDGIMGPKTWGAIFEVYLKLLEQRLQTDAAGLSALQQGLQFVSGGPTLGCGEWLPVEGARSSAYRAAEARRVELLFFDPGDEPPAAYLQSSPRCKLCTPYFEFRPIEVEAGPALVWISLQSVDELGFRLPGVELIFRSGGEEVAHATDSRGLWHGQVRADAQIELRVADGRQLGLGSAGAFAPALHLDPAWAGAAVTDVMIEHGADQTLVDAHQRYAARYDALDSGAARTLRTGAAARPAAGREPMEQPAPDGNRSLPSRRAFRAHVADNLFMAAELEPERLGDVLRTWLEDYYPEVLHRDFFLELLTDKHVAIFDSAGQPQQLFELAPEVRFAGGRVGLHALLETGRERGGQGALFADLASSRTFVSVARGEGERVAAAEPGASEAEAGQPQAHRIEVTEVAEVIADKDRAAYLEARRGAHARGQLRLLYFWRPDARYLAAHGGTGVLESYPADAGLRAHVHARNLAVVRSAKKAYGEYIHHYIEQVRAIDAEPARAQAQGKAHPELQLFELLPPMSEPVLPAPPGANRDEQIELYRIEADRSEFQAWKAITEKHNEIWGVRTAGSLWLAVELGVEKGFGESGPVKGGGKGALKLNFELSTDHKTEAIQVKRTAEAKVHFQGVEVDSETGVVKGSVPIPKLEGAKLSATSDGKITLHYGAAKASYDAAKSRVGIGGSVSLKELVRKARNWGQLGEPTWVEALPDIKVEASLNAQLARPWDIMRIIMRAPGLEARGPTITFMTSDWAALWSEWRAALTVLGFNQQSWDARELPEATTKPFDQLSGEELNAVVNLPVEASTDWIPFWQKVREEGLRSR